MSLRIFFRVKNHLVQRETIEHLLEENPEFFMGLVQSGGIDEKTFYAHRAPFFPNHMDRVGVVAHAAVFVPTSKLICLNFLAGQ